MPTFTPAPRPASGGNSTRAFTLVELLVVIGIIAVLVGILLPTLGKARASARSLACQANLRQIGQACLIYSTAFKGSLPIGYWDGAVYDAFGRPIVPASADRATHWDLLLQSALSNRYGSTWNTAAQTGGDASKLKELFQCPDAPGSNDKAIAVSGAVHYLSHPRLMPQLFTIIIGGNGNEKFTKPYSVGKIRRSAEIAMIFDGALVLDSVKGVWKAAGPETPVGNQIDNQGIYSAPFLLDNYSGTTKSADDSVDMTWTPAGTTPNTDNPNSPGMQNIRFRHMNNTVANALMADGHVEAFTYNKRLPPNDKNVTTLRRRNIYVNQVRK